MAKPPGAGNLFGKEPAYNENLKNCIKNKIPILAGTDAGNYAVFYGYSLHREMQTYCKAGMSNVEALRSATWNFDKLLPEQKTGKIEKGYMADIVVLNENPMKNISNTEKIAFTIHQGKIAQRMDFKEIARKLAIPVALDPAVFDFDKLDALPAYITIYNDQMAGGGSSSELSLKNENAKKYLALRGKVIRKTFVAFAGWDLALAKEEGKNVDLSAYSGVAFEARGNGEKYLFKAVSSQVRDFNYHSKIFTVGKEWAEVKLNFSEFSQNPFYGKKMPLNQQTITSFRFEAADKQINIELDIKNIRLIKK